MVTRKIAKLSDASRRHRIAGNRIMLEQVNDSFGTFLVTFLFTDSLNKL